MSVATDPIADFLTQIRNAAKTGKPTVNTPGSKLTIRLAEILKQEGFIDNFKAVAEGPKKWIRIQLKYVKGKQSAIQSLVRISKPGIRQYVNSEEVPRVLGGLGVAIISTSKGIMTDRQARSKKVGGEVICKVW